MAQSRVQKGKGNKSKLPMWAIGIVVVLVVAIAGYAIVRFSKAGSYTYDYKTPSNGMKCTGNIIKKSYGSIGSGGSFCNIKANQRASAVSYAAGFGTLSCAYVDLKDKTLVALKLTLYSGTTKKYEIQRNFYAQNTATTGPDKYVKPGNQALCTDQLPIDKLSYVDNWGLEVINKSGPDVAVYAIYKTDPNPTPGWN